MRSGKLPIEGGEDPGVVTLNPNGKTGDGINIHVRRSCELLRCADHLLKVRHHGVVPLSTGMKKVVASSTSTGTETSGSTNGFFCVVAFGFSDSSV